MSQDQIPFLTRVADYAWERARDSLVLRDKAVEQNLPALQIKHNAMADAFTEVAQVAQAERDKCQRRALAFGRKKEEKP